MDHYRNRRWVSLEFPDREQELRYQQARDAWLRTRILPIAALVALLFLLFVFFDRVAAPEQAAQLAQIRLVTGCVLVSIGLLVHMGTRLLTVNMAVYLITAVTYASILLTYVVVGANSPYRFTGAIMLIQTGTWFLGGMTFSMAARANLLAIPIFISVETLVIDVPQVEVIQRASYILALAILGGVAAFNIEKLFRANFAITESINAQRREFQARAMRDGLTGLWNRQAMVEHIASACRATAISEQLCAVFLIDLDGFKPVNDRHGHQAGDEALVSVARRIQSVLRPSDSVGRIGGDEFLALAENFPDTDYARHLAERIRSRIESPMRVRIHGDSSTVAVNLGASMGMEMFSGTARSPEELIRGADLAMYEEKARRNPAAPR